MVAGSLSKRLQVQSTLEAERQKFYYDRKANVISLVPGNLVLAKANAYSIKRNSEWPLGRGTIQSGVPGCWRHVPSLPQEKPADRVLTSPLPKLQLFLIALTEGTPLCMVMWAMWARYTTTMLEEQTLEGKWDWGSTTEVWILHCQPSVRQMRLL